MGDIVVDPPLEGGDEALVPVVREIYRPRGGYAFQREIDAALGKKTG